MIDTQSDTWLAIEESINENLQSISRKLASKSCDYEQTVYNRGMYAALMLVKQLPDKPAITALEIENYL